EPERGFSAAGLADQGHGLSRVEGEVDLADHLDPGFAAGPVIDVDTAYRQQGLAVPGWRGVRVGHGAHLSRSRGSRACSRDRVMVTSPSWKSMIITIGAMRNGAAEGRRKALLSQACWSSRPQLSAVLGSRPSRYMPMT